MTTLEMPGPLDPKLQDSIDRRDFGFTEQELRKLLYRHQVADQRESIDPELINLIQELWHTLNRHSLFWKLVHPLWSALTPYSREHFEKARQDYLGTEASFSETEQ